MTNGNTDWHPTPDLLIGRSTWVGPDGPQIPPSRLALPAADYPSSVHPRSLLENQTANRLGTFLTNWNFLTTEKWVLQAVSGYRIPLLRPPRQWRPRPMVVPEGRPTELMRVAFWSLISRGGLTRVAPCPQQFISTLFLVEKGSGTGEFCPVINLKALNRFLPKEKFKMEGFHTAYSLLCEGDYMMKLDLGTLTTQSQYIRNRGNIFASSLREQQSSSVASRLASLWLPDSSSESSVLLWQNCARREYAQSLIWTISS